MAIVDVTSQDLSDTVKLPSGEQHMVKLRLLQVRLLESEDTHFHHDSAVLLPKMIPASSDEAADRATEQVSGVVMLAACLKYADSHSDRRLLVVGHTDSTGDEDYNLVLSRLRANNVLSALKGDKDTWVETAKENLKTEDIQAILKWLTRAWGWSCDPGEIDNLMGRQTRTAIHSFQESYNREFDVSIDVDGVVGNQTLEAFFDLYMQELTHLLETDREGLSNAQSNISFISANHEAVGCGEFHPIEQAMRSGYRSESNRRVEILFFEPADAPRLECHPDAETCVPEDCLLYNRQRFEFVSVPMDDLPTLAWLDLQTVDAFGYRVPNFDLELRPDHGEPRPITTDETGYWSGRVRANERIMVYTADGQTVHFGASDANSEETAIITVSAASRNVTDLIVPTSELDEERIQERHDLVERYGRSPRGRSMRSIRGGGVEGHTGEEAAEISSRGSEHRSFSSRTWGNLIADNLCIAAGWDNNQNQVWQALQRHVETWLGDRFPTAIRRGYYINLLYDNHLLLYEGTELVQHYSYQVGLSVRGAYGIYTTLEFFGAEGNTIFTSMATQSHFIGPHRAETTDLEIPEDDGSDSADNDGVQESRTTPIWELVDEAQRESYQQRIQAFDNHRMLSLVYHFPSVGVLQLLARHGGTGLLEDYPSSRQIRDHVHQRNLAVVRNMSQAYGNYIRLYVSQVEAIPTQAQSGEPHPEVQLHRLGPPDPGFTIARPVGATQDDYSELLEAASSSVSGFRAWRAISDKLDEIWQERPEGSMWMVVEFAAEPGGVAGPYRNASVKLNFEVRDDFRVVPTTSREVPLSVGTPASAGLPANVQYQTKVDEGSGREIQQVNFSLGRYGVEAADDGNMKFSAGPAFSEFNQSTAQGGFGFEVSLHDLVERRYAARGQEAPDWVGDLPNLKLKLGIYFQLISEGTVLRIVSNAPGFFEMRSRSEFITLDWNSLDFDEQSALETLGWDAGAWNMGNRPESATRDFSTLTAHQKVAATRLPVPTRDPYWLQFWFTFSNRRNIRVEGEPSSQPANGNSP